MLHYWSNKRRCKSRNIAQTLSNNSLYTIAVNYLFYTLYQLMNAQDITCTSATAKFNPLPPVVGTMCAASPVRNFQFIEHVNSFLFQ